jgi:hypothetical protein
MAYRRLIFILVVGGLATYLELKPIKHWNLWPLGTDNVLMWFFVFATLIFTLGWLPRSLQLYKHEKKFTHLVTPLAGLVMILIVLGHNIRHNVIANSKSVYEAYNYDIGSDGGLKFEFKEGGHLLGTRVDRFSETFYAGTFRQKQDTLLLNIVLDFQIGRHAYIYKDTLMLFKDDTTKFYLDIIEDNK